MNKTYVLGVDVLGATKSPPVWKVALGASVIGKLLGLVYLLTRMI